MIKGVIFDFNGTLFMDSKLHEQTWRDYSEKLRGIPFSDEEMQKYMFGRSNEEIITYAIGRKPTAKECLQWANEKEAAYRKLVLSKPKCIKLTDGAVEFFDYLVENNIPHTIATGSEKTNVDFFVEIFNLEKWFDIDKIVYDDYKTPGKPNPAIYLKALEVLNLDAKETLVFEDSLSGLTAAHKANIGKIVAINETPEKIENLKYVYSILPDFKNYKKFFQKICQS